MLIMTGLCIVDRIYSGQRQVSLKKQIPAFLFASKCIKNPYKTKIYPPFCTKKSWYNNYKSYEKHTVQKNNTMFVVQNVNEKGRVMK